MLGSDLGANHPAFRRAATLRRTSSHAGANRVVELAELAKPMGACSVLLGRRRSRPTKSAFRFGPSKFRRSDQLRF